MAYSGTPLAARSMDRPAAMPSTAPAAIPPCQAAASTAATAKARPREMSLTRYRPDRDISTVHSSTVRLARLAGESSSTSRPARMGSSSFR